jgi:hypothetical protein
MNKYIKLLAISFLISCGSKSDEQYQDKIGIEIKDTLSINESAKLLIALSNNLNSLENQKKYFNFFQITLQSLMIFLDTKKYLIHSTIQLI